MNLEDYRNQTIETMNNSINRNNYSLPVATAVAVPITSSPVLISSKQQQQSQQAGPVVATGFSLDVPEYNSRIHEFMMRYEINPKFAAFLEKLTDYTSVLILDDSGSMASIADPDVFSSVSRWQELQRTVQITLEIHQLLGITCDCYFINRGNYLFDQ